MRDGQARLTALILIVACVLGLVLMGRMSSGLRLPQSLFRVSTWWRAMTWTAVATAAAFAVAIITPASGLAGAVLAAGAVLVFAEAMLMSYAKTWGPRE